MGDGLGHRHVRAAIASLPTPGQCVEVPADTPAGPPHNVAHPYRRLANAIHNGTTARDGLRARARADRLIDAIARASSERQPQRL
jgi:hypothetical protein